MKYQKTNFSGYPGKDWKKLQKSGTGAIEIKSGYGLSVEDELKMLRVIRKLKEKSPTADQIHFSGCTYLSAGIPRKSCGLYPNESLEEMLPVIAREKLADYIDVFCEKGFFSPEETETILRAGTTIWIATKNACEPASIPSEGLKPE